MKKTERGFGLFDGDAEAAIKNGMTTNVPVITNFEEVDLRQKVKQRHDTGMLRIRRFSKGILRTRIGTNIEWTHSITLCSLIQLP